MKVNGFTYRQRNESEDAMSALKPCPFCGRPVRLVYYMAIESWIVFHMVSGGVSGDTLFPKRIVPKCDMSITIEVKTKRTAERRWNERKGK